MTDREVRIELARQSRAAGSQKALARTLRISLPYLNDILRGRRSPGPKVLRALGLRRIYERA